MTWPKTLNNPDPFPLLSLLTILYEGSVAFEKAYGILGISDI